MCLENSANQITGTTHLVRYLATALMSAQVCSVALIVFPPGVLGERRGGEGRGVCVSE